jgi:hypothetical protein
VNPEALLESAFAGDWAHPLGLRGLQAGAPLSLRSLLPGVQIELDESIQTLQIEAAPTGYLLRICPAFCREFVRSRADARAAIAHELFHALRGHFGVRFEPHPGLRSLQNLAFDVLVNSAVLLWAISGPPPGLFRRLYRRTVFPEVLLLPPADLLPATDAPPELATMSLRALQREEQHRTAVAHTLDEAVAGHLRRIGVRQADAFARAYRRGWLHVPDPAGYWEQLRALFRAELGDEPEPTKVLLLGCHHDEPGEDAPEPTEASQQLASALDRAEMALRLQRPVVPSREALARFSRQVATALDRSTTCATVRRPERVAPTPIPRPGRRDLPLLAMGHVPALWHPRRPVPTPDARGIRVYVDVSGSMDDLLPLFFALTRALGPRLELPAWAWSLGEPVPVSLRDLGEGRYRTRMGTDFAPVVAHAVARGFRRILVLTDGCFPVTQRSKEALKRSGLELTFVLGGENASAIASMLRPIASHIHPLEQSA